MKTIIITGGSSGLGFELIKLFLEKKIRVINMSKTEPKIENKNLIHIKTNLNCNKSIQRAIDEIKVKYKKFNIIFLNAGIWKFEIIENINFRKVDEIIKTNLNSNIKLVSGLFELIKINKADIFVSGSINYKIPEVNQISYNISKGALKSFADSLKIEFEEIDNKIKYLELEDFKSNLTGLEVPENIASSKKVAKNIIYKYF